MEIELRRVKMLYYIRHNILCTGSIKYKYSNSILPLGYWIVTLIFLIDSPRY